MGKRNNPETSKEANRGMTKEMRVIHFQKILAALNILGEGIYTEIASKAGMEHNQISRRLLEMINEGLIERLNKKRKTPSGRNAFVHRALVGITLPESKVEKTSIAPTFNNKNLGGLVQIPLFQS